MKKRQVIDLEINKKESKQLELHTRWSGY
jgi:hypothetical protein